jgi:hypothetical protein
VARLANLAAPEVRAAARFNRHLARRQVAEERQHLIPSQLLAQNTKPQRVSAMRLKNIRRQVEPDRDNLRRNRPPVWISRTHLGTSMPSVGGHIINAVRGPFARPI